MVFSSLNLHWVNDLPGCFSSIRKALRDDGLFLGAMFGEFTLQELRNSFLVAEQEREGGISPHTSPFARVSDIGNLLTRNGFSLTTIDSEEFVIGK
jgi:NADH dehydrogenase [ubiquinone] 1 alpha subcomplex assembly factor 5